MADDPIIRSLFDGDAPPATIDVDEVIRRSRRRRRPRVIAERAGIGLAVVALVAGGVYGAGVLRTSGAASSTAAQADGQPQSDTAAGSAVPEAGGVPTAPDQKLNLCGGALADVAPATDGLTLTPHFPDAPANGAAIRGTVTITNSGTAEFVGGGSPFPSITLSQSGVTLWHSNGAAPAIGVQVDLKPGASMTLDASLTPVKCATRDDLDGFRGDLPALPAGDYQVTAALTLTSADGTNVLVTGPAETITLR